MTSSTYRYISPCNLAYQSDAKIENGSLTPRVSPGLMVQSDEQIAINDTYSFTSYALWRDLGYNQGIFGTETRN